MRRHRLLIAAIAALLFACESPPGEPDAALDTAALDTAGPDTGLDSGLPPGLYPIAGPDEDFEAGDLDGLPSLLGDAEVIGIGESVHTTGGELAMRARLIRWLVTHHGVREIVFEMSRAIIAERVAPHVDGCVGTAEDAAALGFNPIWWDRSTPELLAWLCAWNASHPEERVRVRGTDIRQPWVDLPTVRALFTRLAPAELARTDGLASCLGTGFSSEQALFSDPTVRGYFDGTPLPQAGHDACVAASTDVRAYLAEHRADLVARSSELEVERARLAAVSLEAFDTSIYNLSRGDLAGANPLRDAAMADVFLTEHRYDPPSGRTVLFAHNGHSLRHSDEVLAGQWRGVSNLATLIDVALNYVVIGQASRISRIDWQSGPQTLDNGSADHLERVLDDLGAPYLLMDVAAATGAFIPADQAYEVGFDTMVPARHYDLILFHHESRANDYFTPSPWSP
jgi:erythromycin esterase